MVSFIICGMDIFIKPCHMAAILPFFYSTQCNKTEVARKVQSGSFDNIRIRTAIVTVGYWAPDTNDHSIMKVYTAKVCKEFDWKINNSPIIFCYNLPGSFNNIVSFLSSVSDITAEWPLSKQVFVWKWCYDLRMVLLSKHLYKHWKHLYSFVWFTLCLNVWEEILCWSGF